VTPACDSAARQTSPGWELIQYVQHFSLAGWCFRIPRPEFGVEPLCQGWQATVNGTEWAVEMGDFPNELK